jgi:hypothetical protein
MRPLRNQRSVVAPNSLHSLEVLDILEADLVEAEEREDAEHDHQREHGGDERPEDRLPGGGEAERDQRTGQSAEIEGGATGRFAADGAPGGLQHEVLGDQRGQERLASTPLLQRHDTLLLHHEPGGRVMLSTAADRSCRASP